MKVWEAGKDIVDPEAFKTQLGMIVDGVRDLEARQGSCNFDVLAVLAASGFPAAEIITTELAIPAVVGISTYKGEDGVYRLGDLIVPNDQLDDVRFFIGDNASDTNRLLPQIARVLESRGAQSTTFACVARLVPEPNPDPDHIAMPDIYAQACKGKPPEPYWKKFQRPGIHAIARHIESLGASRFPDAILALGVTALTPAAELSKCWKIDGRRVGGLGIGPDGLPDTRFAQIGDCNNLNVLIMAEAGIDTSGVSEAIMDHGGRPRPYTLNAPII